MSADLVRLINELAGTSLAVGSLGVSIWSIQVARGRDFFNRLKTHAGVDTDELLVELVSHDEQRQMVFTAGLERSLEADWERTRDVLAKVVAETLRGDEWRLDEVTLLLRTASQLGRNDVTVLTELAKPERDRYEDSTFVGAASDRDISSALPADTAVLLPPVLGALSAQGLIVDGALGTWSYGGPRWLLTPYAFRFLRYLFPAAEVHQAVLAVSLGTARLYVRNLGRSDATVSAVEATSDGRVLNRSTVVPFPIRAGEQVDVACDTDLGPGAGARLRVAWRDGTEVESIVERYQNGS